VALIGGAVCALLFAGCGPGADASGPVQTVQVNITDSGFDPSSITLGKTGTYDFHYTNHGTKQYAVDIEGGEVDKDGAPVNPGASGDVQVDLGSTGTYQMHSQDDYADRSHELHGTVTVKG
jgi:hypothetical protein